jgi:hypothetical protein
MFARKIRIPISFLLFSLTLGAILLAWHSSMLAEQPAPIQPAPPEITDMTEKGPEDKQAAKPAPFGFVHDFGDVPRGTPCKHSFRIVNTSNVPLRIISFNRAGCSRITGRSTKDVLQPWEEGELEISLDTRLYSGHTTIFTWLHTDNGKLMYTYFLITADVQDPPLD